MIHQKKKKLTPDNRLLSLKDNFIRRIRTTIWTAWAVYWSNRLNVYRNQFVSTLLRLVKNFTVLHTHNYETIERLIGSDEGRLLMPCIVQIVANIIIVCNTEFASYTMYFLKKKFFFLFSTAPIRVN